MVPRSRIVGETGENGKLKVRERTITRVFQVRTEEMEMENLRLLLFEKIKRPSSAPILLLRVMVDAAIGKHLFQLRQQGRREVGIVIEPQRFQLG